MKPKRFNTTWLVLGSCGGLPLRVVCEWKSQVTIPYPKLVPGSVPSALPSAPGRHGQTGNLSRPRPGTRRRCRRAGGSTNLQGGAGGKQHQASEQQPSAPLPNHKKHLTPLSSEGASTRLKHERGRPGCGDLIAPLCIPAPDRRALPPLQSGPPWRRH